MNRIKVLRKEKGITVKDLAKKIGISQSMLSNYENGNSTPREQSTWDKLARIFDVDVPYLMGLSHIRKFTDKDKFDKYVEDNYSGRKVTLQTFHNLENDIEEYSAFSNQELISSICQDLDEDNLKVLADVAQSLWKAQLFDNQGK